MHDVWRNKSLFWSVVAGFVTIFSRLYIPVINHVVFKHTEITWEWEIVEVTLFVAGVERWKWGKRIYIRCRAAKADLRKEDSEKKAFSVYLGWNEKEAV